MRTVTFASLAALALIGASAAAPALARIDTSAAPELARPANGLSVAGESGLAGVEAGAVQLAFSGRIIPVGSSGRSDDWRCNVSIGDVRYTARGRHQEQARNKLLSYAGGNPIRCHRDRR